MKKTTLKLIAFQTLVASSLLLGLTQCKTASDDAIPAQPYDKGVLVLNQGNYSQNNGSITLLDKNSKTVSYDIFQKENNRSLAGTVIDYTEVSEKGIIVLNNSTAGKNTLEIVNAHTFKSVASITGVVENPRHAVMVGTNKAYVTCWDSFNADYTYKDGYVAVLDLTQNKIIKKIAVQAGAEDIIVIGNEAYVGNVFTDNKKLTIIDISKDEVKTTIEVGANPQSLRVDANNKLWFVTGKEIVRLNPTTQTIEARISVGSHPQKTPNQLTFNKDKTTIFFTYYFTDYNDNYKNKGEVYAFNITDTNIPANKIFINRVFTGLGYDTEKDILYAGVTPSYNQAGYVLRFQPNGTLIDSIKTEIAPSLFYMK